MFGLGKHDETVLLEAVWACDKIKVKQVLLKKVELVNSSSSKSICRTHPEFNEGDTALHLASRKGDLEIIKFLLSLKAMVDAGNADGKTPLHYAASSGGDEIVDMLMEADADADAKDHHGRTPLYEAVAAGGVSCVHRLLGKGAYSDAADKDGDTPLHAAVRIGSEPIARALLTAGAKINASDEQDRTPLHLVAINADHGVANNASDAQVTASRKKSMMLAKLLVTRGANVNALDRHGDTPLDLLMYLEGKIESDPLVDMLRSHGGHWVRYRNKEPSKLTPAHTPSQDTMAGDEFKKSASDAAVATRVKQVEADATIELGQTAVVIGRELNCTIRYHSLTLSRRHAQIEPTGDGFVIVDLGSRNGVIINGEKIDGRHFLQAGDVITLGAYEFEFDGNSLTPITGELSTEDLERERRR
ncbi:MAG: hypothetical protein CMJ20_06595 [Phycisphaeraceae bacterium]|nr:hypothetical protein [Phycisphaeraceae bacterium]|tara:strand:+ start:189 stop:1439 length:1251 start_codon:yes stop_codon:yes gene_type:complete